MTSAARIIGIRIGPGGAGRGGCRAAPGCSLPSASHAVLRVRWHSAVVVARRARLIGDHPQAGDVVHTRSLRGVRLTRRRGHGSTPPARHVVCPSQTTAAPIAAAQSSTVAALPARSLGSRLGLVGGSPVNRMPAAADQTASTVPASQRSRGPPRCPMTPYCAGRLRRAGGESLRWAATARPGQVLASRNLPEDTVPARRLVLIHRRGPAPQRPGDGFRFPARPGEGLQASTTASSLRGHPARSSAARAPPIESPGRRPRSRRR